MDEADKKARRREYLREWRKRNPGYQREWAAAHPEAWAAIVKRNKETDPDWREKQRANSRRWKAENPAEVLEGVRSWQGRNPEKVKHYGRVSNLRKKGITVEEFDSMLLRQGGRCAICRREPSSSRDRVADHCHETGRFRGVLCQNCNLVLGHARDSVEVLLKAAEYLKQAQSAS